MIAQQSSLPICGAAVSELQLEALYGLLSCSKPYPCVSDEHYYPTVLAAAGLSNETTCAGNAMHVDWARAPGNGSPFTYWMKVDKARGYCAVAARQTCGNKLGSHPRRGMPCAS
jgi:hypothetical protein